MHGPEGHILGLLQAAGTSKNKTLQVSHTVLGSGYALRLSRTPLHVRRITLQKGDIVSNQKKLRNPQFVVKCVLDRGLCLLQPARVEVACRSIYVGKGVIRIEFDTAPRF